MATSNKPEPHIPLNGIARDGWSKDGKATATCFCGAVQLVFPVEKPGLVSTFVCNCTDCRKVTASMFASNFIIDDAYLEHARGRDNLKTWGQDKTIASGNKMTNAFCSTCGTLMYRISSGYPGMSILRIGTVDDFNLHDTKLAPQVEQYTKDRVSWLGPVQGARHVEGDSFTKPKAELA